ncbi:hypothetical protein BOX15_Mlig033251g3 [Macrostomum lignano]|uniref:Uncharacterized protein n=1 Tax=Macrostomum lignano TaxID=282301 RepID=A0A267E6I6_9PLAT|nr:hypothetical protein BOX15_Mlig033251g3 [Macrostomum lignano]
MLDWMIVAVGGGLLAAGCAAGSVATKLLQRLLFSRRAKKESSKSRAAAAAADDAESAGDGRGCGGAGNGDGMEDLLFDEKLKLLVLKENLKKKLRQQKQLIRQLMLGASDGGQASASSTPTVGCSGDVEAGRGEGGGEATSSGEAARRTSERQSKQEAEAEFFAAELQLSNWQN